MLKIGVPRGGVKQKMRQEGLDPAILDMDPTKPPPSGAASKSAAPASPDKPKVIRKRIFWEGKAVRASVSAYWPWCV